MSFSTFPMIPCLFFDFRELLDLPAIADGDFAGSLPATGGDGFYLFDHVVALHDLPKDDMLAVQVRRRGGADEELRAVGVRPGIRHRQGAGAEVLASLPFKGFVIELAAVDRLTAGAVAAREISPLAHKTRDHAVERRALEVERLPSLIFRADAKL